MKYLYFPGCSLDGTALEYNISTRAVMEALGIELIEINEWACCGASAAEATSELLAKALAARTIALGERMGVSDQIMAPCSACYLNLMDASQKMKQDPELLEQVRTVLAEENLTLKNKLRIKHALEALAKDIRVEGIKPHIKKIFNDFKVAPYYGCQCLRPYVVFDDPEEPQSMRPIIEQTGAEVIDWEMGSVCCSASHISTKPEVGIELVTSILKDAQEADVIVTVCPMCQMNLEAYQSKISNREQMNLKKTILYLPQLLGLAMGLPESQTRLDLNLAITKEFRRKLKTNLVEAESMPVVA